jgi:hypothetical protein
MAQPLCRIFVPLTLNGYVSCRYQVPCMLQKPCMFIVTSYLLLQKMPGSTCVYLKVSKLLKTIADKNKSNIAFSYCFLNIIFTVMGSVLVMVLCLYLAETQEGFRFSQFPPFEIAVIVTFIFCS